MKKTEQIRLLKTENTDLATKHEILEADHERLSVEHADLRLLAWALFGPGGLKRNGEFTGYYRVPDVFLTEDESERLWRICWKTPQGTKAKIYLKMDSDGLPKLPLPAGLREAIQAAMENARGGSHAGP